MTTVTVLRGLPASGKSTWVKQLAASSPVGTVARINNDDLVQGMFPESAGSRVEGLGELLAHVRKDLLKRLIATGVDEIVVDNTNLRVATVSGVRPYIPYHLTIQGNRVRYVLQGQTRHEKETK